MDDEPWYGVRCVFELPHAESDSEEHWYEERVTLWRASSFDDAIELAEAEAQEHAFFDTGTERQTHWRPDAAPPGER